MNQNAIDAYKRAQSSCVQRQSNKAKIREATNDLHTIAMKIRMMTPVVEGMMQDIRELTEQMDEIARKVDAYS